MIEQFLVQSPYVDMKIRKSWRTFNAVVKYTLLTYILNVSAFAVWCEFIIWLTVPSVLFFSDLTEDIFIFLHLLLDTS